MKLPVSADERRLLTELFAPGRAIVAFAADTATATRLHHALQQPGAPDLPRADLDDLARLLGAYLQQLGGPGAPLPATEPVRASVDLAAHAPQLAQLHAQLVRHLEATA
jgi:hypothetical protein